VFFQYNDFNGNSTGIPQSFIIDADRNVRWAKLGPIGSVAQVTQIIDELV
jgi:hypothetical protein